MLSLNNMRIAFAFALAAAGVGLTIAPPVQARGRAIPTASGSGARRASTYFEDGLNGARALARRHRQHETGHNDQRAGFVA